MLASLLAYNDISLLIGRSEQKTPGGYKRGKATERKKDGGPSRKALYALASLYITLTSIIPLFSLLHVYSGLYTNNGLQGPVVINPILRSHAGFLFSSFPFAHILRNTPLPKL